MEGDNGFKVFTLSRMLLDFDVDGLVADMRSSTIVTPEEVLRNFRLNLEAQKIQAEEYLRQHMSRVIQEIVNLQVSQTGS